ncbi:hypothetical protein [Candidatus Poriferisocius sp.]|uniref:hypothetical protein n=1 Tax=Candidatus Poriferisocius sp. TaxID=3101276 RepID=UPI003B01BA19
MTSHELFALADDLQRQALICDRLRAEVDPIWFGLDEVLNRPVDGHAPAVWQSATADASRLRLRHQRSHLVRLRYEIQQVARRLADRAESLYGDAVRARTAAEYALREEARELELQMHYFR